MHDAGRQPDVTPPPKIPCALVLKPTRENNNKQVGPLCQQSTPSIHKKVSSTVCALLPQEQTGGIMHTHMHSHIHTYLDTKRLVDVFLLLGLSQFPHHFCFRICNKHGMDGWMDGLERNKKPCARHARTHPRTHARTHARTNYLCGGLVSDYQSPCAPTHQLQVLPRDVDVPPRLASSSLT